MDVVVVLPPVGQAVDKGRIAVMRKNHRFVRGEERVEIVIRQPVGVFFVRLQGHQIDNIDHANP